MFYGINNGDDDKEKDYQQLSNYTKNTYWNIPIGDGKYFAIPKPRELAVLSSFFETCMEYGLGGNTHSTSSMSTRRTTSCPAWRATLHRLP